MGEFWATRIWGSVSDSSATWTVKVYPGGRNTTATVAISRLEFDDPDDIEVRANIIAYCQLSESDLAICPSPVTPSMVKRIDAAHSITYELRLRNDDGPIRADCAILHYYHD